MAKSLIEEIQQEALNEHASVSSLLRKVKLAAAKLKLGNVEAWVDEELKGYACDGPQLPKYRQGIGTLKIWNPYHGWQPVGGDPEMLNHLSQVFMWDPIAAFENIAAESKRGTATYPFSPTKLGILSELVGQNIARAGVDISHGALITVVDTVRTLILEWAIQLEKLGITGEGISFSKEEEKIAQSSSNTAMHIGSIQNFTGVLGAHNATGDITSSIIDIESAGKFVSQVKSNSKALIKEGVTEGELKACLTAIEASLRKADQGLIRKSLEALQKLVARSASGLISTGILTALHQILGTGASG